MHAMYEKYRIGAFGCCPQVFCQGQPVLPVGLSDMPRTYTVNLFCPRCQGLFYPKSTRQANLDGAYFGTTFAHLYLMMHPELVPQKPQQEYRPRIYGFKIHESSLYYKNREVQSQQQRAITSGNSDDIAPPGGSGNNPDGQEKANNNHDSTLNSSNSRRGSNTLARRPVSSAGLRR
jgi:casein kinase II subunit beta